MQLPERENKSIERNPRVEKEVLARWVSNIETIQLSEHRKAVINSDKFLSILEEAQAHQKPVIFVAIGCQDWIKPDWGDPQTDRLMGRIRPDDKRAKRFIAEMVSFSSALSSLLVPHQIYFSLSDIEPLLHIHLNNMGLVIHNEDAEEVVSENVRKLAERMLQSGVPVQAFAHSQLLAELLQTSNLAELQTAISGNEKANYRDFLDKLYMFDLDKTQKHFATAGGEGPVWLDIQSFNFADDVTAFEQAAQTVAPELPVLSVFPNAGNWHAAHQPSVVFPSREDIFAQMVGSQTTPQSVEEWVRKLHKTRDEVLSAALEVLMAEKPQISSSQEKTLAVRMFFQLAFNFDPLSDQKVG